MRRSRRSRRRRVDLDPQGLGSLVEGRRSGSPPTPARWSRDRPCKHLWCLWDWRTWAEGLGCQGPAARPAAHASARLIRLSGDVTPLGPARSAASSHCSGGSRSAHSRSQRNRGPARRPARPGARSSGKPERVSASAPARPPPPGQGQVSALRSAPAQLQSSRQVSQSALSDCQLQAPFQLKNFKVLGGLEKTWDLNLDGRWGVWIPGFPKWLSVLRSLKGWELPL